MKVEWTTREILYQIVHLTLGFGVSYLGYRVTGYDWFMFAGFFFGLMVEIVQIVLGNRKYADCVRDLVFWTIGGMLVKFFI